MFLLKLESQPDLTLFMHVVGTVLLTVIAVYLHQHQGDNEQHYHHYIGKHHSSFQGNPIKNYNFIYINITYIQFDGFCMLSTCILLLSYEPCLNLQFLVIETQGVG